MHVFTPRVRPAFFFPWRCNIHGDFRKRGRLLLLRALDAARPAHTRARGAPRRHGSDHRPRRGSARRRADDVEGDHGWEFVPDEVAWREELAEFIRRRGDQFMSC